MRSVVAKDAKGRDALFTVVLGAPASLGVVDVATGDLITSHALPGVSGVWGVLAAPDGTIYMGGYNEGKLYRYFPKTDELKDLGKPFKTNDTVLYPMAAAPDGKIYGGTYDSGHAYEFDPQTEKYRDLGDMTTTTEKERWLRVTVYDDAKKKLYFGIGNKPQLVEYDLASGSKRDILPAKFGDITAVYDLDLVGNKLFCRKENHNAYEYFVLNRDTGELVTVTDADTGQTSETFLNSSRGVSPKSPVANKVYYSGMDRNMYEYDLDTDTVKSLKANVESAVTGYAWVKLDDPEWPGYTLTGSVGNQPRIYRYNPQTGKSKVFTMELPQENVNVHDIICGPDGKIYSGGYLAGNLGAYDPAADKTTYYDGSGQTENMAFVGRKLYMGIYPDAKIYEYDIDKPFNGRYAGNKNPRHLFDLTYNAEIPGYTAQDRPFAMAGSDAMQKVFIGTTPKNGMLGGVLAIHDVNSSGLPEVHWNIIKDQSINSLFAKDGLVYGGTSIHGGMGKEPEAKSAEFFVWDIAQKKLLFTGVPVEGAQAVMGIYEGPDGKIWGLANGTLFTFDPKSRAFGDKVKIVESDGSRFRGGSLVTTKDGMVYGTAGKKFFKLDPKTKAVTLIADGADEVEQDHLGNIYLMRIGHAYLYQYKLP